jgi:hypothetical protein
MKTKTIFRTYRDKSAEVVAIFPELPHDRAGMFAVCYAHNGQHGAADVAAVIARTRPSTDEESAPLSQELHGIGYKLEPIARTPRDAYQTRKAATL